MDILDYLLYLCSAVSFLIGLVLGYILRKRKTKYGGEIEIRNRDLEGRTYTLNLDSDPAELEDLSQVTFKIKKDFFS